ncbi:MAG TPA: hypothetical protein VMW53_03540 [archaeon]|nr:hypothetical protein [archaeon]
MKKFVLFYIFLIFLLHTAAAQSIITIDVHEDGNAIWTMEKHLSLETQTDVEDWEEFIAQGQDSAQSQKDLEEFSIRINGLIESAEVFSNRPMVAENFEVEYDTLKAISGSFGIVRFSFEWKNFSEIESENILIGDVFSEGMILTSENVLILQIPGNYDIESVSPDFDTQDGTRLVWDGSQYRSFDKGEPALVLSRKSNNQTDNQIVWYLLIIILFGSAVAIYFNKRGKPTFDSNIESTPLNPAKTMEDLEDEEMIVQILNRSGGQVYQSEIVKEMGLSKSKISILLTKMKEEGKIIKIRKGKENIIRLATE